MGNVANGWTLAGTRVLFQDTVVAAGELHDLHGPPEEVPGSDQVIPRAWIEGLPTGHDTTSPKPEDG